MRKKIRRAIMFLPDVIVMWTMCRCLKYMNYFTGRQWVVMRLPSREDFLHAQIAAQKSRRGMNVMNTTLPELKH